MSRKPRKSRPRSDAATSGGKKAKRLDVVSCLICPWTGHRGLAHEHHITPRKADGGDEAENLAILCATCHHIIHMVGHAIQHGKANEARDMLALSFPDPGERRLATKLSNIIAIEFAQQRDRGGPTIHTVTLPIPDSLFKALKVIGKEQKMGVARLLLHFAESVAQKAGHDPSLMPSRKKTRNGGESPLVRTEIR